MVLFVPWLDLELIETAKVVSQKKRNLCPKSSKSKITKKLLMFLKRSYVSLLMPLEGIQAAIRVTEIV